MLFVEINPNTQKAFAISTFSEPTEITIEDPETGEITAYTPTLDLTNLVPLDEYDVSIIGKIWTGAEWIEDTTPPQTRLYIPSNAEIYENQLIIMEALADIAEMNMEG